MLGEKALPIKRRFQLWLASIFQVWSWRLSDTHNTWEIVYRKDDRTYVVDHTGGYRLARIRAKELKGYVSGYHVATIDE